MAIPAVLEVNHADSSGVAADVAGHIAAAAVQVVQIQAQGHPGEFFQQDFHSVQLGYRLKIGSHRMKTDLLAQGGNLFVQGVQLQGKCSQPLGGFVFLRNPADTEPPASGVLIQGDIIWKILPDGGVKILNGDGAQSMPVQSGSNILRGDGGVNPLQLDPAAAHLGHPGEDLVHLLRGVQQGFQTGNLNAQFHRNSSFTQRQIESAAYSRPCRRRCSAGCCVSRRAGQPPRRS